MERLIKENERQRQDINQLQFTNEILEEHIHKNIRQKCNKMNDQMQAKEKGEKNYQNKGMKTSKKKIGINSKSILKCTT